MSDGVFSTARGGYAADAGSFTLEVPLNGKVFQHYFLYTNLALFNYYYRKDNVQLQHHGWPPETKETGMQATEKSSSTT